MTRIDPADEEDQSKSFGLIRLFIRVSSRVIRILFSRLTAGPRPSRSS
jgi:hypothetical protein